jgi:hypothetical protein
MANCGEGICAWRKNYRNELAIEIDDEDRSIIESRQIDHRAYLRIRRLGARIPSSAQDHISSSCIQKSTQALYFFG